MSKPGTRSESSLRLRIADEAARIMIDQGVQDFGLAKRKASENFGVSHTGALPGNAEIEAALTQRRELFDGPEHEQSLAQARRLALQVMDWFAALEPRAVGGLVSGALGPHGAVELHLFADAPEDVAWGLHERNIPYRDRARRYRRRQGEPETFPLFSFAVDGVLVELVCFPTRWLRQAPLSSVDGKPLRRLNAKKLGQLLGTASG